MTLKIDSRGYVRTVAALVFTSVASLTTSSLAQADEFNEAIVVSIENDIFTGSDNNYTNGFAATWTSDALGKYESQSAVRGWASLFDFLPGYDATSDHITASLVHEINTPSDITISDPPLDDQPYSGVLLFGAGFYSETPSGSQVWSIRLGAVGPITQADHIQRGFHELIGADEPLGWNTQLPNEPLLNIGYVRSQTLRRSSREFTTSWRLNAVGNLEVGNYAVAAGAGGIFEVGGGLEGTRATASIENGIGIVPEAGSAPSRGLSVSTFLGAGAFAVGHFAPLDGTTFRDSRSVDYNPVLGFGSVGVTAKYGRLIASFSLNKGTTFNEDDAELDYGAVSIGWTF